MNMKMKKGSWILFLMILAVAPCRAQQDSIGVSGKVVDAFTGMLIEDGRAEVCTPDSVVIGPAEWTYGITNGVRENSYVQCRLPRGRYLLRLSHKDYLTEWVELNLTHFRRNSYRMSKNIRMVRLPKSTLLGEAVVKATKIKMVMKGDTIVYNADAFQLSQGSMLDALIAQLPGAVLKPNGQITVNGRAVSSLLVNGKDFFKGDPRVALENLPSYMVDKVKVYEKLTAEQKLSGVVPLEKPLVMDVNLKKQYSIGWIANAEAAYGTHDRWLGRVFALRFTDCSRLALYGNLNNTNDTRKPGTQGEWTPSYLPDGLQESYSGGMEYFYETRDEAFHWRSNLNATHTDNHTFRRTDTERFLQGGRAYGVGESDAKQKSIDVRTSHELFSHVGKEFRSLLHMGNLDAGYSRHNGSQLDVSAEFDANPYALVSAGVLDSVFSGRNDALLRLVRNRRKLEAISHSENWNVSLPYRLLVNTPVNLLACDHSLTLTAGAQYDHRKDRSFDHLQVDYFQSGNTEPFRNRYFSRPSTHYRFNGGVSMNFNLKSGFNGGLGFEASHDYRKGRQDLYRLDRLDSWGEDTEHAVGSLPSSSGEMQQALDVNNSEHSRLRTTDYRLTPSAKSEFKMGKVHHNFRISLPVTVRKERLLYDRSLRHYDLDRTRVLLASQVQLQQIYTDMRKHILEDAPLIVVNWRYRLSQQNPQLIHSVELVNDADPLYVQYGNAGLHRSTQHSLSGSLSCNRPKKPMQSLKAEVEYNRTKNALGMEQTYHPETGGSSVRPVNIDGNWDLGGHLNTSGMFGKQKRFSWSTETAATFYNSVDCSNVDGQTAGGLSVVKNFYLQQRGSLGYSNAGWSVNGKVNVGWNHVRSRREDFSTISAVDFNYGGSVRIPLPWNFSLHSDFTVFSRRGYSDASLNEDNLMWNARLETSVLKGNLVLMVEGFDLLRDLSKVTRSINAQGRVESYTNVIPSYFMAHVVYRLNIKPKKK